MDIHDTLALRELANRYAAAVDACDTALFQSVFTRHGRLRVYHPGADDPFSEMVGHHALARVPDTMRGRDLCTMHAMSNHRVSINGDRASGTVLCTARHLEASGKTALNVMIRYIDEYVRDDGEWKIVDRQIRFLWSERHVVCDSGYGSRPERVDDQHHD